MSDVDWDFWLHMPAVNVWQACALSLGIDPDKMKHCRNGWMAGPGSGPFFEASSFRSDEEKTKFYKRLRLFTTHISRTQYFQIHRSSFGYGTFSETDLPYVEMHMKTFVKWAISVGKWDNLSSGLLALVEKQDIDENKVESSDNCKNKMPGTTLQGKQPKTAIGKLAIKAAWEIERRNGKRATAKEVMDKLQTWADKIEHPETLQRSAKEKRGVYWLTTGLEEKLYTLEACRKTLSKWNKK